MVKISVQANNDSDTYLRDWGIYVDAPPLPNWQHTDGPPNVEGHRSGDVMAVDLPISDGKHTVYFITSQPKELFGGYSGTINVGGLSKKFTGAAVDFAIQMQVNVSGGNVTSETNTAAGSGNSSGASAKISMFLAKIGLNNPSTQRTAGVVVGIGATLLTIVLVVLKKKRKF